MKMGRPADYDFSDHLLDVAAFVEIDGCNVAEAVRRALDSTAFPVQVTAETRKALENALAAAWRRADSAKLKAAVRERDPRNPRYMLLDPKLAADLLRGTSRDCAIAKLAEDIAKLAADHHRQYRAGGPDAGTIEAVEQALKPRRPGGGRHRKPRRRT